MTPVSRDTSHPVKDVVLPLAVVIGLIGNALIIGIAWGKFTVRMDLNEGRIAEEKARNDKQDTAIQALRDRAHDLERDAKQDRLDFLALEDYTRGRIDRLPYHPPPAKPGR